MLSNDSIADVDSPDSILKFCITQPRSLPTQRTGS